VDAVAADFALGTVDASTRVTETADGEIMLAPANGGEFGGSTLPAGWSATPWQTGGTGAVNGGLLTVNGARVHPAATYGPGRSLEFVATFGGDGYAHAGFGLTLNETPWAIFSTGGGNMLVARTHSGATEANTVLASNLLNAPHRFRIDWTATAVTYYVDGVQVASHPIAVSTSMRPIVSDYLATGATVRVDWMRMTPYAGAGTYVSRVLDAAAAVNWTSASWNADLPAGTSLVVSVRTGNTATPDATWSPFTTVSSSGAPLSLSGRYAQYRVELATSAPGSSPALRDLTLVVSLP
jgi:hypothetical protein